MWSAHDLMLLREYCADYKLALMFQVVASNARDQQSMVETGLLVHDCRARLAKLLAGKEALSVNILAAVEQEVKQESERQQKLARRISNETETVREVWQ